MSRGISLNLFLWKCDIDVRIFIGRRQRWGTGWPISQLHWLVNNHNVSFANILGNFFFAWRKNKARNVNICTGLAIMSHTQYFYHKVRISSSHIGENKDVNSFFRVHHEIFQLYTTDWSNCNNINVCLYHYIRVYDDK